MKTNIGVALREANRNVFETNLTTAAEITYERSANPLRADPYLGNKILDLPYRSLHCLKISPSSADPPNAAYLEGVLRAADENQVHAVSDHLGFTNSGPKGRDIGHFCLPPLSQAAVDATSRNIERIQKTLRDIPFFIENIAYFFQLDGDLSEEELIAGVLDRTGCGLLLDVTNVYANARNHGFDPYSFIARVAPLAPRVQIHLAGGHFGEHERMYLDSHSHPVPAEIWELYRHALRHARGKVEAVFLERDENIATTDWAGELGTARRIVEEVEVEQ